MAEQDNTREFGMTDEPEVAEKALEPETGMSPEPQVAAERAATWPSAESDEDDGESGG